MKIRLFLLTVTIALGALTLFIPEDWPPAVVIGCAGLFAALGNALVVDTVLRRSAADQTAAQPALRRQSMIGLAGLVLFALGIITSLTALVLWQRLTLPEVQSEALRIAAVAFGILGIVGLVLQLCARIASPANPLKDLRAQLPVRALSAQVRDAMEFQRVVGPRLFVPLAMIAGVYTITMTILVGVSLLVLWVGWQFAEPFSVVDFEQWPLLIKLGFLGTVFSISSCLAAMLLACFRLVARARRQGRVPTRLVWRDAGLALETVGLLGTFGWGMAMVLAFGILGFASLFFHYFLVDFADLSGPLATALSLLSLVVLGWLMVFFPQMYVMAIMVRRDCGWMNAMEVSLRLVELEGREAFAKAMLATLMGSTILGLPGAIYLLLASLDGQELILSKLLSEKTEREIREALGELSATNTGKLAKFYDLLDKGRYLDALNGFQMYLRTHREDADATRGEALAFLHMGNPRARESLERWERLEPENPEATEYLAQLAAGLWAENGEKFLEADRRCTQRIGVGVTGMTAPPSPEGPIRAEVRNP